MKSTGRISLLVFVTHLFIVLHWLISCIFQVLVGPHLMAVSSHSCLLEVHVFNFHLMDVCEASAMPSAGLFGRNRQKC